MTKRAQDKRLQRKREMARDLRRRQRRMRLIRIWVSAGVAVAAVAGILIATQLGDDQKPSAKASPTPTIPLNASPPSGVRCKGPRATPSAPKAYSTPPPQVVKNDRKYEVTMVTTCGTIKMTLDPKAAPKAVNNFVFLAKEGFYNGLTFHRVEQTPPFQLVQGGDPKGDGTGDPGYQFAIETPAPSATSQYVRGAPPETQYLRGVVAMANSGQPDTNGSQFFIVYRDVKLKPDYTVLGKMDAASDKTIGAMMQAPVEKAAPRPKIYIVSVTVKEI